MIMIIQKQRSCIEVKRASRQAYSVTVKRNAWGCYPVRIDLMNLIDLMDVIMYAFSYIDVACARVHPSIESCSFISSI